MQNCKNQAAHVWLSRIQALCNGLRLGALLLALGFGSVVLAADSSGRFIRPSEGSTVSANVLLVIEAQDNDGIKQVRLSLNNSAELLLCDSEISCGAVVSAKGSVILIQAHYGLSLVYCKCSFG